MVNWADILQAMILKGFYSTLKGLIVGLYKTRAIVLRSINLSETDKLITFLTEHYGKIKCAAKSARKFKSRFGAALEPLSCIQIIYFGKENQGIFRLNNCDIIQSFQGVREDLSKIYTALYFTELVDSMVAEGQRSKELFIFLLEAIDAIKAGLNLYTLCRLFELRIMALTGYGPRLDLCAVCKKTPEGGEVGYSFNKNSVLCLKCGKQYRPEIWLKSGAFNYVRKLANMGITQSERLKIPKFLEKEVEFLTHRILQNQLGQETKTYPFIKKMAESI